MRRVALFSVLLALALVVAGISLAVLRHLHWSVLSYILVVPIWIGLLPVLLMVGRAALNSSDNGVRGGAHRDTDVA